MPFWDGPDTMLPAFEGVTDAGEVFRTSERRQFRHLVVAFAEEGSPALSALAARYGEIRANTGDLVVVAPPEVALSLPPEVAVVRDAGGIAAKYRPILPEWNPPVVFVGDRYGELMAVADARDPNMAEHVAQWVFSNEVQCAL